MIQFIQENYVWFIVGGIVLVMVIIGYFAEKTDFGAKKIEKKEKKQKNNEVDEKEIANIITENGANQGLGDLVLENAETKDESFDEPINEDLTVPFGDPIESSEETTDFDNPFASEEEKLTENSLEENIDSKETNVEENIDNTDISDTDEQVEQEKMSNEEKEETTNVEEITESLPNIDEVKTETVNSDDDIWNF